MIQGMKYFYEDMLRELGLFNMEKRTLQGDLRAAFQYLKKACKKKGDRLCSRVCCGWTRRNVFKPKEKRFRLDIRKKLITIRVMRHSNRLPKIVDAPSLEH